MKTKKSNGLMKAIGINTEHILFSNKIIISFIIVIIITIVGIVLLLNQNSLPNLFKTKNAAETSSKEPSAQSDFNGGKERDVIKSNKNEGTVTDSNGVITNIPQQANWQTSQDQVISVYYPAKNALLSNGQPLSGEAKVDKVSFRLIDDVSGVIAQGTVNVVSGKFSGVFNFTTTASEGRVDVFVASSNGVESSIVEIPVRFK